MKRIMNEMAEAMEIMDAVYERLWNFSHDGFLMFLGVLIDQYGADHEMTSEETLEMVKMLMQAQKTVHAELGMPERSCV